MAKELIDWNKWLEDYEAKLVKMGYKKYTQGYKSATFIYWKTFRDRNKKSELSVNWFVANIFIKSK